jgi:HEXXH motif-containing protein
MMDIMSYATAFASPAGGEAAGIVRALATGRLNGTRRRVAAALADSGRQDAANSLLAFTTGTGSAWRPETGLALLAHREQSPGLAGLQLAAALGGAGGRGRMEVRTEEPQWLYLDGWLTPVGGRCGLTADGRSITIDSDLGSASSLVSGENRWAPSGSSAGPWIAYASGGLAPRYVAASGLRHSVEGFPWIAEAPPAVVTEQALTAAPRIATIHRGWQLILDRAPMYGSWVASTAAGCLLLDPSGKHTAQSGSSYDHPGLIAIEPPDCPVFCGEILVHECAHQHLLIYGMVTPLVAAGSTEVYYSPIKRARRSIDRVLSGAHAIGNMILYYAALRRTMALDPSSQERFDRHCAWFAEDYRPALNQSESLTEPGRALWNSLCHAVDCALEQ